MKRVVQAWALVCAALIGCAGSDGGPVGTGISMSSASISGNVIDVQTAGVQGPDATNGTADDGAVFPAITVSIDGTAIQTHADASGNFALSGDFSGAVTLRFAVPQFQVTQSLDVPSGSAIVLQDVELRADGIQTQAARQLNFDGRVALVDCTDGTLVIDDARDHDSQFTVHLLADTSIVRNNGDGAACAAIAVGTLVEIEGYVQLQSAGMQRVIPALTVTLEPTPGAGAPPPIQEVAFAGSVAALNCDAGFIVVDDSMSRSRVALSADTVITGVAGEVIDCRDLDLGEGVIGRGQIALTAPGPIDAISLQQTGSPAANTLRVFGFVSYIDCAAGLLLLSDPSTSTPVHLGGGTTIVGTDNTPLQCTNVALGDRIAGTGEVSTDAPGAIEGALLVVTRGSGLRRH